ncbi:MAG TPA: SCO family protein [Phycisphaerales bacterium]|nr:SCO family protein [Phycisphaerales bacterium]HMP36021.1 SCO family protein [Phycisphaerales bacterium]
MRRAAAAPALLLFAALAACFAVAAPAAAQGRFGEGFGRSSPPVDVLPDELVGVDITERLDEPLPLDLPFVDDAGRDVTLRRYFDGRRPVVLQIGYLKCPMLCNLVLNELVRGLKDVDLAAGREFQVVSVSVNPIETHELAAVKKQGYLLEYGRAASSDGWHFLTGPESSSRAVADAVGFGYRYDPDTGEYAHAAAVILCTPDGRVSRYLYGVRYEPSNLKLGLLEASEGKIGSTLDRIILWCHIYDPDAKGYVVFALRLMKLGGLVTLVVMFGGLSWLWVRELQRRGAADRGALDGDAPAAGPARRT